MPRTESNPSTERNRPCSVRYCTIACAVAGPMPGSASSWSAVAVFRSRTAGGPDAARALFQPDMSSLATFFSPAMLVYSVIMSVVGALGLAVLDYAHELNIGLSSFVSVGNKADVSGNDLLSFWREDPRTDVVAFYLESFGNPRKFARLAPAVGKRKPIVAVKAGRSAAGSRAASSHSASLACLDVAVDALFEQAGVIRTDTLEDLFDVVASGAVKIPVNQKYPLKDAQKAHRDLESRGTTGSTILLP